MPGALRQVVERLIGSKRRLDQREAQLDLLGFEPRTKDMQDLYWAARQDFPDDRIVGSTTRGTLLGMLSRVRDARTPMFVLELFPTLPPNPAIYESALGALAELNTPDSLRALCDILVRHGPKLRSDDNGVFTSVIRSPKNAGMVFPGLLMLLGNKTYRRGIYEVAAAALDAHAVTPGALAPARQRLIGDFRRAQLSLARTEYESVEYQGRLRYLTSVLTVMGAFPDDAELRAVVQGCVEHRNTQVAFAAYRICRRHGWNVPENASARFAAEPATRLDFFELLQKFGRESEFPNEWRTQEAFAEADMVRWCMSDTVVGPPPLSISLVESRAVTLLGERGRVYIYRLKRPWISRGWLIGLSGPQPLNAAEMVVHGAGTFSADCSLRDMSIDEHLEMMEDSIAQKSKRKKRRNS